MGKRVSIGSEAAVEERDGEEEEEGGDQGTDVGAVAGSPPCAEVPKHLVVPSVERECRERERVWL